MMEAIKRFVSALVLGEGGGARRVKLRTLVLAVFLLVVFLPVLVVTLVYAQHSADTVAAELSNNMLLAARQLKSNLDYRFEQLEESALSILTAAYPYIISEEAEMGVRMEEYQRLRMVLAAYENKHMISRISLFVPRSKIYAGQQSSFYGFPPLDTARDEQGQSITGPGITWVKTHEIKLYETSLTKALSCRMALVSRVDYNQIVSVLELDIEERKLSRVFTAGLSSAEEIYLVDENGVILSHREAAQIGLPGLTPAELSHMADHPEGSLPGGDADGGDLVAFTRLEAADWTLVMRVPSRTVYGARPYSLDLTRVLLILAIFAIFMLGLVLMYIAITQSTIVRITNTIQSLEQSEAGQGRSSLMTLERSADQLVITIKGLLEGRYVDQIKMRDYQLTALQAQINPHFLYNTLDAIKWMIMENRVDDSVWMVNALSKYFRLSLSGGRDVVELETELNLMEAYIGIVQKRFQNVFSVETDIDRSLLACQVPKLSVQPIVENALLHGILDHKEVLGLLTIRAWRENDRLTIAVSDNGKGMTSQQVAALTGTGVQTSKGGYGLSNVRERLILFGGPGSGLTIDSAPGRGTTVTLALPIVSAESGHFMNSQSILGQESNI